MNWFDGHLDLACLAENGRDMTKGLRECGGPWQPAAVTLPSLAEGNVKACLGTIFTEADGNDAVRYPAGDAESAHAAGVRQLDLYRRWEREGKIRKWQSDKVATWQSTLRNPAPVSFIPSRGGPAALPISLAILMECADPIRTPEELVWWVERGVVAVGLAWARGSRYAGGNGEQTCATGLTDLGREMVRRMDVLGVVHDISHLSDPALSDLLSLTKRPVMASHSNCRALLDGRTQRHLTDETIGEVGRRGGVIGLNLVRNFIRAGLNREDLNDRPSIDEALAHVEHICQIVGHKGAVGLGSDLDGGISAHDLPRGINSPRDFDRLAGGLSARGWSDAEVHGFAWGNWARFFGL